VARHIPGPLYYEQQGASGTPMLFLHSTPDDHRLWMFQTAHFSAWYRCIAVDFAGYGRAPAPPPGGGVVFQAVCGGGGGGSNTAGGVIN
jgi:pimeloyl-ACP methyl ester carboxylesterase